jgi:RNA polymerase sigma-70 factor (ECF subfamily)
VAAHDLSKVELTRLLQAWSEGDASALERLTPLVYAELHQLVRHYFAREREGHVLQPSALVNEAFVRLMDNAPIEWVNRAHFFAAAARLMRQILIDFARAQEATKRGRRSPHVELSRVKDQMNKAPSFADFIDLDVALTRLAQLDARQARVVELRYFGGLENSEVARVLGISEPTAIRDWRIARAWLNAELQNKVEEATGQLRSD